MEKGKSETYFVDSKGVLHTKDYLNYMNTNIVQQGWQCPICKRVLAPFVTECPCGGQGMQTWTVSDSTGTLTLNNEEISKHIPRIETYYKENGEII